MYGLYLKLFVNLFAETINNGGNTKVAVMDSGALLAHPDLSSDRITGSHVTGKYGSSGNRYPQSVTTDGGLPYEEGQEFDVTGNWMAGVNDSHGTHVTGTVGANRDGSQFHGVAWGADVIVGNTGATDNNNYGPYQDHDYFLAGWSALADDLVASNGMIGDTIRGGVINNSWGTNVRIIDQDPSTIERGADNGNVSVHLPTNTVAEAEYEYFYSNMMYGTDENGVKKPSFVDAAWEAVKDKNVVQIFTTGNRDMANPFYRPLYPYFNPEAEKQWIAVAGLKKASGFDENDPKYELVKTWNEAGLAKYWTVAAPGNGIYGSKVNTSTGEAMWGNSSGTSMSAPHVAGAMGVLMSRYQDMTALQVRDVMFTTANHKNADGSNMEGWNNVDGTTPLEGEVSDRMGWGVPDLEKGMYGPGQFLGKFDYNMANTKLDVWTNDITQVALDQRKREDMIWMEATSNGTDITAGGDYVLGEDFVVNDGTEDATDHIIDQADAEKWRAEYYAKRAAAIQEKLDNGLYNGSLVKRGEGTLVMTGHNTYRGGTTVEGGTLLGFSYSFGTTDTAARTVANGQVTVNGGSFGVIASYDDPLTGQGTVDAAPAAGDASVDITVNEGGKLLIIAGQDVTVGNITMNEGSLYSVAAIDSEGLVAAYNGEALTGSLTADSIEGMDKAVVDPDYAFFKTTITAANGTLTAAIARDEDTSFASYANNGNAARIAAAAEAAGEGAVFEGMLGGTKAEVAQTLDSLSDDAILNTRNASIVNGMTLVRSVKDQAQGFGSGRTAETAGGARLWATGVGSWSSIDYGQSDMDSDFYAGLVGAEIDVCSATKLGLFFGAGTTENKAGRTKVESDDIHLGAYGVTSIADAATISYGIVHTHQDADTSRALQVGANAGFNAVNGDADLTQIFAEAAWTGFNTDAYTVEPYFGFSWIHAKSDGFSETVGGMTFETTPDSQNVQVTTLGVRGALPFSVGSARVALKGDVAWSHFFGDTEAEAKMKLAGSGVATIKGGELSDMATIGLGLEAQVGKMTTFGLSYTGAYDGDITSHGITANVRFNF